MYAYQADASSLQPSRDSAIATLVNWLKERLEARRKAKIDLAAVDYLRTLDRHLLNDIGVDVAGLTAVHPSLASFHPHAVVASFLTGPHQSR